jgi:glycerol kinase
VRSLIFDESGNITAIAQAEFTQFYPHAGWVEHNALEIWEKQLSTIKKVIELAKIKPDDIATIGITNQRETTVMWDKETGKPVYNAIVWQDKRTSAFCDELKASDEAKQIHAKTGLVVDSYFSATKAKWIFENVTGAREAARAGKLLFGTIDTWILWNLTGGKVHATDHSNASRTMLYDINELSWCDELLEIFSVEKNILPQVLPSGSDYGVTDKAIFGTEIPINALIGDQQSALFGQCCFKAGDAKNTYGTGCFLLMNIGDVPKFSESGIITTIAWGIGNKVEYAMEAAIFDAGSAIGWCKKTLGLVNSYAELDRIAETISDTDELVFIPSFSGLGVPHWNMEAKASITGITHATGKAHFARGLLEGIALQVHDVFELMQKESGHRLNNLNVDGGLTKSNILMQIQADILQKQIIRPENHEMTAKGAAYMAGITAGIWNKETLQAMNDASIISPCGNEAARKKLITKWQNALKRNG